MGNNIDGQSTKVIKTSILLSLQLISTIPQGKIYKSQSNSYFIVKSCSVSDRNTYDKHIAQCTLLKGTRLLKSSNIVQFEEIIDRNFCSSSYSFRVVEQYHNLTLKDQINRRRDSYPIPEWFSHTEIIQIYQFLMDLTRQFKTHKLLLPVLNLNNIKITSNKVYKHISPIQNDIKVNSLNGQFYAPQNFGTTYSQPQIVFSIGMTLLSLCLLDDLGQCYNYRSCSFCWSVFQEKIMNLGQRINEQLIQAICMMIQKNPKSRLTLEQCSSKYRTILKNINLEDYNITKNMLTDVSINSIYEKSRSHTKKTKLV